jgi:hypothetical protein
MLAAKDISMSDTIYMPLLDEGTKVWRQVPAWKVNDRTYIVLRPDDYDPADEHWEFPPGSTVDVEITRTSEGEVLAAVRRHSTTRRTA